MKWKMRSWYCTRRLGTELADLGVPGGNMDMGESDLKSSQCWGGQSTSVGQRREWPGKVPEGGESTARP